MIALEGSLESTMSSSGAKSNPSYKALSSSNNQTHGWEFEDVQADFADYPAASMSSPPVVGSEEVSPKKPATYSTEQIKGRQDVFIAGRGGEAIFHNGNVAFRQRVLEHTETYAGLKTCERGRKFARRLLNQYFWDVTFVVRHSYFFKNFQKGTISKEKIESVRQEHGGSFETLKEIPTDHYFTVGETWILGIISDIVRFGGKKLATTKNIKRKTSESSSATVSDDDESAAPVEQRPKKRARRRHTVDTAAPSVAAPSSSPAAAFHSAVNITGLQNFEEGVPLFASRAGDTENLADQLAELNSLVKLPLPSAEEDAGMFADDEMVLEDAFGDVVPL